MPIIIAGVTDATESTSRCSIELEEKDVLINKQANQNRSNHLNNPLFEVFSRSLIQNVVSNSPLVKPEAANFFLAGFIKYYGLKPDFTWQHLREFVLQQKNTYTTVVIFSMVLRDLFAQMTPGEITAGTIGINGTYPELLLDNGEVIQDGGVVAAESGINRNVIDFMQRFYPRVVSYLFDIRAGNFVRYVARVETALATTPDIINDFIIVDYKDNYVLLNRNERGEYEVVPNDNGAEIPSEQDITPFLQQMHKGKIDVLDGKSQLLVCVCRQASTVYSSEMKAEANRTVSSINHVGRAHIRSLSYGSFIILELSSYNKKEEKFGFMKNLCCAYYTELYANIFGVNNRGRLKQLLNTFSECNITDLTELLRTAGINFNFSEQKYSLGTENVVITFVEKLLATNPHLKLDERQVILHGMREMLAELAQDHVEKTVAEVDLSIFSALSVYLKEIAKLGKKNYKRDKAIDLLNAINQAVVVTESLSETLIAALTSHLDGISIWHKGCSYFCGGTPSQYVKVVNDLLQAARTQPDSFKQEFDRVHQGLVELLHANTEVFSSVAVFDR